MSADKRLQAQTVLRFLAGALVLAVEPLRSLGIKVPNPEDLSEMATVERIGALSRLAALAVSPEYDAAELLSHRLPGGGILRPCTSEELSGFEEIAASLSDGVQPVPIRFGPRPVRDGGPQDAEREAEP